MFCYCGSFKKTGFEAHSHLYGSHFPLRFLCMATTLYCPSILSAWKAYSQHHFYGAVVNNKNRKGAKAKNTFSL